MAELTQTQQYELEILIDETSLFYVLDALCIIAREKAEHIRTAWQDTETARVWDKAADRIEAAAMKVNV